MKTGTSILLMALVAVAAASGLRADISAGWNNANWADKFNNAHDFFDVDNWDQGIITGEFGSGLGTAKTTQYIKFGQDWSGMFSFTHSNEANLTFVGDGTRNATWHVPGDVVFAPSSTKGTIAFGNETAGRKFLLDLGGEKRKFVMGGTAGYVFVNGIGKGDLEIDSTASVSLRYSDAAIDGDLEFYGLKLQFDSSKNGETGTVRAVNVLFRGNELEVKGNNTASAAESIDGKFTVDGSRGALKLLSVIAGGAGASLTAGELSIENGALLGVRGAALGGTPGAGVANVFFETVPATIGGAGGTECPVIPGVIAAPTYSANSILGYAYDTSLATYDSETGVRPLDFATEYVNSADDVVSGRENLLVAHGTSVAVSGDVTVNSVVLQGGEGEVQSALTGGDGAMLHVTSGQVLVGYHRNTTPSISVPIDFGDRAGCISHAAGKNTTWTAPISGSRGVSFTWFTSATSGSGNISMFGDCTYTGDTHVNGEVSIGTNAKVLPCGDRTGDVHVNGILSFNGSSSGNVRVHPVINGLYGNGTVKREKYTIDIDIGDNDADGDFGGSMTDFRNVAKVGAGTQRFDGTISCLDGGTFNVNAGKVVLDGTVTQGAVNVAAGAAIGGDGTIATTLTFVEGAEFTANVADDAAACLNVTGAVTGGAVTVNANVKSGKWRTPRCVLKSGEAITANFVRGEGIGSLELRNNDTELWATPKVGGFAIIFR